MANDTKTALTEQHYKYVLLHIPTRLWCGLEDRACTPAMTKYLEGTIPNAVAHYIEGKGHLLFFTIWEELLSDIREVEQGKSGGSNGEAGSSGTDNTTTKEEGNKTKIDTVE